MPAWSDEIAGVIVRLAAKRHLRFDQLQLQSLVYIAHGWRLAAYGEPLTGDRPILQQFGPEYERIAQRLQTIGLAQVSSDNLPGLDRSDLDQEELDLVETILDTHAGLSVAQFASITCDEDSPWTRRSGAGAGREIGHNEIRRQFEAHLKGEGNHSGNSKAR